MRWFALTLVLSMVFAACLGCEPGVKVPPLGTVTGTVTLDGKPMASASVRFIPQEGNALDSSGMTDGNGKYKLDYYVPGARKGQPGAVIGRHAVRIETFPIPGQEQDFVPVPGKYNTASQLTAEVKAGPNTFDFPLTSR